MMSQPYDLFYKTKLHNFPLLGHVFVTVMTMV